MDTLLKIFFALVISLMFTLGVFFYANGGLVSFGIMIVLIFGFLLGGLKTPKVKEYNLP